MKKLQMSKMEGIEGGGSTCTIISVGASIFSILGLYPFAFIGYAAAGVCYLSDPAPLGSGGVSSGCDDCPHLQ
jgi:hypothetical protein